MIIQKKREEKSWVLHKVKIWIVMKKEEKRRGSAKVKIWDIMKKEEKRWGLDKVVIWNCMIIQKKGRKIMGLTWSKYLDCYGEGIKKKRFGQSIDLDSYVKVSIS